VPKIGRFSLRLRGYCTYTPLREAALKIILPQGKSPLRKNGQNNKPGFCLGRRNLAPFAGRLHSISGVLQTQTQTPTPFPQPSLRQTQNTHPHTNSTTPLPPTPNSKVDYCPSKESQPHIPSEYLQKAQMSSAPEIDFLYVPRWFILHFQRSVYQFQPISWLRDVIHLKLEISIKST
jgi:hypothetical protein